MTLEQVRDYTLELSDRGRRFYSKMMEIILLFKESEAFRNDFLQWVEEVKCFVQSSPESLLRNSYHMWQTRLIDNNGIVSLEYLQLLIQKLNTTEENVLCNFMSRIDDNDENK